MKTKCCRVCRDALNDDNWSASCRKGGNYICKKCKNERARLWRNDNPDMAKTIDTIGNRKRGKRPMSENRECASFLGVHVAERVLRHVFNDVEVMPYGNPGYDIICNRGKLVDSKSSCLHEIGRWHFNIGHNTIADYFLCLAFDNRDGLNLLHAWLLPGEKFNHLMGATIRPSTIDRWDEYRIDTDDIISCCNEIKDNKRLLV